MRSHMATEIAEQPSLIRARAQGWDARARVLREMASGRRQLVVIGRGSSGNAATFATYVHALRTGRQAIELRPWITTQTEPGDHSDCVAFAYSVSGKSTDVAHAAGWLRQGGAFVIGVTNALEQCLLDAASDERMSLDVGPELAVPATKTFSAQLFVSAALCGFFTAAVADEVASCMEALMEGREAESLADFLEGARQVVVIARGPLTAAALDAALKL